MNWAATVAEIGRGVMILIRAYQENDAGEVGRLIAATFSEYNLAFASLSEREAFLGPFQYADSNERSHQEAIVRAICAEIVLVAEKNREIVGVLRGKTDRLQSLFVRGDCHRQGIGRRLVEQFEQACREQGASKIRLRATLFAVPFYQAMGYRKTTGVRRMKSFEGQGLPHQPMKKILLRE